MDTDIVDRRNVSKTVGVSRGANYIFHRSDIESMIGVRSHYNEENPIYGSCGFVDRGDVSGARGYGDIVLSFRPDEHGLSDRATYTTEDSFHSIDRITQNDAAALRVVKSGAGKGFVRLKDYVEVQITGGVNIHQVAEIFVPEGIAAQVKKMLTPALLEKVTTTAARMDDKLSGDYLYDNTSERALVEKYRKEERALVEHRKENKTSGAPQAISTISGMEY